MKPAIPVLKKRDISYEPMNRKFYEVDRNVIVVIRSPRNVVMAMMRELGPLLGPELQPSESQ